MLRQQRSFCSSSRCFVDRLPASYYRGGTSRGVIFQAKHLPPDKSEWNQIFLGVIGSPDPYGRQLDGMGGGISSLSKVCIVGPSSRADADVDYTFVAIGVKNNNVDFSSNCGNMSSAIGPFAVDAGLFQIESGREERQVTVRVHNTNTSKIIESTFPVNAEGEFEPRGTFQIDGVAGQASRIKLDFVDPSGSRTGKMLPTGREVDVFDGIRTTCIDVGNPCCFVQASELGVSSSMTPAQIEEHPTLLAQLDSIRRQAGAKMGLAQTPAEVPESVPKVCMVGSPDSDEEAVMDLKVRALSVGQPHKAVPITVALSTAAASRTPGTVVQECVSRKPVDLDGVTIGHASGRLMVGAEFDQNGSLKFATVFRTARRLMEGTVFWK